MISRKKKLFVFRPMYVEAHFRVRSTGNWVTETKFRKKKNLILSIETRKLWCFTRLNRAGAKERQVVGGLCRVSEIANLGYVGYCL